MFFIIVFVLLRIPKRERKPPIIGFSTITKKKDRRSAATGVFCSQNACGCRTVRFFVLPSLLANKKTAVLQPQALFVHKTPVAAEQCVFLFCFLCLLCLLKRGDRRSAATGVFCRKTPVAAER